MLIPLGIPPRPNYITYWDDISAVRTGLIILRRRDMPWHIVREILLFMVKYVPIFDMRIDIDRDNFVTHELDITSRDPHTNDIVRLHAKMVGDAYHKENGGISVRSRNITISVDGKVTETFAHIPQNNVILIELTTETPPYWQLDQTPKNWIVIHTEHYRRFVAFGCPT